MLSNHVISFYGYILFPQSQNFSRFTLCNLFDIHSFLFFNLTSLSRIFCDYENTLYLCYPVGQPQTTFDYWAFGSDWLRNCFWIWLTLINLSLNNYKWLEATILDSATVDSLYNLEWEMINRKRENFSNTHSIFKTFFNVPNYFGIFKSGFGFVPGQKHQARKVHRWIQPNIREINLWIIHILF